MRAINSSFKLMLPLLLDERIASAAKVTASLKVCAPVVLTLPPILVLPGASVVTLVNTVVAPTVLPRLLHQQYLLLSYAHHSLFHLS